MVKPGYKQTEIGMIPENWDVKPLKAVAPLQRGFDLPYSSIKEGKYPVVFSNGVGAFHSSYMVKGPGVITGRSGTIGKIHYVENDYWPHNTALWVTDFHNNTPLYVYYLFKTIPWNLYNSGSGVPTLNRNDIHDYLVAIPSRSEQAKISTILADIDSLVVSFEKQLSKKKAIKQGAMQELLTGKKRLPGFSGRWVPGKWKEVLDCFSSGATPYRGNPAFYKGKIKWVSSGELNYNRIVDTLEHISPEAKEKANLTIHPAGTFLMAITGLEAAGTRGSCAILGAPATTNQSCMAIYGTDKMSTEYLFHYYVQHGDELAFQYCQGTKQQSYTAAIVKELPIYYPEDVTEQNAIASVLSSMDDEIRALEQKLAKYRQVKQGMMQQLLTGKIRLV